MRAGSSRRRILDDRLNLLLSSAACTAEFTLAQSWLRSCWR